MTIVNFTPTSAAIGGALIGLSAVLLMLLTGRIAGISGIFAGVLPTAWGDHGWRFAFLAGLLGAPIIGGMFGFGLAAPAMPGWIVVVIAGLLVGYGTRLGGGCTSGHGVCGIARLSPRSIAATLVFMAVAVAVVALQRHVLGG
jgi:uncharacterized membrane protein YedE/YeeE